jgi:hypothetical protein
MGAACWRAYSGPGCWLSSHKCPYRPAKAAARVGGWDRSHWHLSLNACCSASLVALLQALARRQAHRRGECPCAWRRARIRRCACRQSRGACGANQAPWPV